MSDIVPHNRLPSGRFPRGVSGNPGGKPRGINKLIAKETKEGKELIVFLLNVLRKKVKDSDPKLSERIDVAKYLLDRYAGRVSNVTPEGDTLTNVHVAIVNLIEKLEKEDQ